MEPRDNTVTFIPEGLEGLQIQTSFIVYYEVFSGKILKVEESVSPQQAQLN